MTDGSPRRPGADDDEVLRFGPGVQPSDRLAETWRAGRVPARRRRRLLPSIISALITALVMSLILMWLLLRGQGDQIEVTAIKVQAPRQAQTCDATVEVTGVLTTNAEGGRITYRWIRSDGHESGLLHETVAAGKRDVTVHLSWVIKGRGQRRFTATLELVQPKSASNRASAAFAYSCR